eukprot:g2676.t1
MFKLGIEQPKKRKKPEEDGASPSLAALHHADSPQRRKQKNPRLGDLGGLSKPHLSRTTSASSAASGSGRREKSMISLGSDSDADDSEEDTMSFLTHKDAETIDVSFNFVDFCENDYHGVRNLIGRSAVFGSILKDEASAVADAVVRQVEVGTAVKADENIFGFATLVKLNEGPFKAVAKLVSKKAPKDAKTRVSELLRDETTLLLLSERVLNFPLQLVPALHENLQRDLAWASDQDEKSCFRACKRVLVLAPVTTSSSASGEAYFDKFEEEIFKDAASMNFTFTLPQSSDAPAATAAAAAATSSKKKRPSGALRRCAAIILPRSKLSSALKEIKAILP